MQNFVIYSITNRVNGKKYVGQTRNGLERRKAEHLSRFNLGERDHRIYQAMREHGIGNFEFEVLCRCLTPDDLDTAERRYIAELDTFKNGYNMTCGGESVSDETREKLSKIFKGRKITWYDKIVASRLANPNRKNAKDFVAKGAANVNAKSYLVRHPDGREERISGLNQFCKEYGLTKKCLLDIALGKQKHHKGFVLLERFNGQPATA